MRILVAVISIPQKGFRHPPWPESLKNLSAESPPYCIGILDGGRHGGDPSPYTAEGHILSDKSGFKHLSMAAAGLGLVVPCQYKCGAVAGI